MPTDDRLKELTEQLENGVKEIFSSGRYAQYLAVMAKFHRYSYGNCVLILMQCPHATKIAGYNKWKKEFGRQVKRGERGIRIIAPCPIHKKVTEEGDSPNEETKDITLNYFKSATVFDVSQTEGKELPSLGTSELTGTVENYAEIFKKLALFSPMPIEIKDIPGTAKGYFSSLERKIVLRAGMSELQALKTLIHEIAHAMLHDNEKLPEGEKKSKNEKEVEAESVAYVVCQHFGIDTSEYSFGYVAGWSKGKELEELKSSLGRIHFTAGQIIETIQPEKQEHIREDKQPNRREKSKFNYAR